MKKRRERRVATVKVTLTKDECHLLELLCTDTAEHAHDTPGLVRDARALSIKLNRARRRAAAGGPVR